MKRMRSAQRPLHQQQQQQTLTRVTEANQNDLADDAVARQ
jgi:hypothetical protein